MKKLLLPLLLAALLPAPRPALAQTTVKKVVLQGFWWDYANNNFPSKWADYLVELAPRLKELGIDAVWLPPTPKNATGTNSVGYSPFDAYDLGDKFQKGTLPTRMGTKDELLRLIAVLHANGIEVIQDVVLNHADGAGTASGAGGLDPNTYSMTANGGFKNFRNASWATPLPETADNAAAYLARAGRWPKNYTNFHAHAGHNTTSGDMAAPYFGPDFCYGDDGGSDGYGPSSNATYNPTQGPGYSRNEARSWLLWMKKQTGVDGVRWDAVKHFSYAAQQDWTYNLKYLNGWASAGESMLSTGEYVGNKSELDNYTTTVNAQNGGSDFAMGTFDFGLRGAIYNMIAGGGNYNLGLLPGEQQAQRVAYYGASNTYVHRTAPFVNSHDTFRPQLNAQGNYVGWNSGQELGAHIEPNDPRLSAAYAVTFAVDGNPHVYMEDLFNLAYTNQRFSHLPSDRAALPVRADLANIIWCHQHLGFRNGAYLVRLQSADHLVIERGGRALIGINDNFTTWQTASVTTSFAPGTVLKDYSGATAGTRTVGAGGLVSISTPPCDGSAPLGRRGYAVWAPVGQDGSTYTPARAVRTTQEWELANDLGDSNCGGLGQGGALPDNSVVDRVAGKVFVKAWQPVSYTVYAESAATAGRVLKLGAYKQDGDLVGNLTTTGVTLTYTPSTDTWLTLKVHNATATQAGQRAYVKVDYQAPDSVNTRNPAYAPRPTLAIWNAAAGTADAGDCRNWESATPPSPVVDVLIPDGVSPQPVLSSGFLFGNKLTIEAGATLTVQAGATVQLFGDLTNHGNMAGAGNYLLTGLGSQHLGGTGPLTFGCLTIANPNADVLADAPLAVRDSLRLNVGRLALGARSLDLGTAVVRGGSAGSYVLTSNAPGAGGACFRAVGSTPGVFPVGNGSTGYAPLTLATGTGLWSVGVGTFEDLLTNATTGAPYAAAATFVQRTWALIPRTVLPPTLAVGLQWPAASENASFQRVQSALFAQATGGSWQRVSAAVPATGTDPYQVTFSGVSLGGAEYLAVGNFGPLAVRTATGPALLTVSPNPGAGQVQLRSTGPATRFTVRLHSVLGQQAMTAQTGTLAEVQAQLNAALTGAAPGVYVLTVQAEGQTQHLRLVRE